MSDAPRGWPFSIVRAWTRLYTAGAHQAARDERRAQVESDLWEHRADAAASGIGSGAITREVAGRMLRSIPADLAWRLGTGGFEVSSIFWFERGAGVLMLLVAVLFAGAVGGPNISGDDPYFTEQFPAFADSSDSVMRTVIFRFGVGLATIATAGLLFQTFRRRSPIGAAFSGLALVAGGAFFIASGVATLELHGLADEWRVEGRVIGDATWARAQHQAGLQESFGFLGLMSLGIAFAGLGVVIARTAMLPRLLAGPALAGGVLIVGSVPLWSAGDWGWYVSMVGMLSLSVSFLLTAGWLTLRGTRVAPHV